MTVDPPSTFAITLRAQLEEGRPDAARGAVLPAHLRRLVTNTTAISAHADSRDVVTLVVDIGNGDRTAETPLYVRAAPELERVAARAGGDSALSREDLHQEAAVKLIEDARSGMLADKFGGSIGPYVGRSVRRHLMDLVDSQRPGQPTVPGRERRRLREALNATLTELGDYDIFGAVQYALGKFEWSLQMFWTVHSSMFARAVRWEDSATDTGLTYAETIADPVAGQRFARVETRQDARRIVNQAGLTARERDVINAVWGFTGPACTAEQAAELLGMSARHVKRIKASALEKLAHTATGLNVHRTQPDYALV